MSPSPIKDLSQDAFVAAPLGNIRLLAPAGCGKTQSVLARCVHLGTAARPAKPRMLLITFTRAAQQELAGRINDDEKYAGIRDQLDITTLNSWGFRRIKGAAKYAKLITTKDDFHFTVKNALQSVWMKHPGVRRAIEAKPYVVPREIMQLIDALKTLGFDHTRDVTADQFHARVRHIRSQGLSARLEGTWDSLMKIEAVTRSPPSSIDSAVFAEFYGFWRDAVALLFGSATFTLEDQKYFAFLDEREKADTGNLLQGAARYEHVFVDEFQDINPLDLALVKAIVDRNRASLTIVGDDDQAIFEWRGATPEFILNPERHFGIAFNTFRLEVNYRSPANIVDHAQRLIGHNTRREQKATRAFGGGIAEIVQHRVDSLEDGIALAIAEVERCVAEGTSPNKVALIGRKRSQLIPYQIVFASRDIPFCAAEDLQVFMSAAFDRLLDLILIRTRSASRLSRSQIVEDALKLCFLVPKWPPRKADKEELKRFLSASGPTVLADVPARLESYSGKLKGTKEMGEAVAAFLETETVSEALSVLGGFFHGLQADLGKAEDDIFYADPPFYHLGEYAERYGADFDAFVTDVERAKDQLVHVPPFEDPEDGGEPATSLWKRPVHLMTALRSKGKEFDSVVLLDVNDGIWPSKHARTSDEREAERRVFYVAFTRARRRVTFLIARRLGSGASVASPYVGELGL